MKWGKLERAQGQEKERRRTGLESRLRVPAFLHVQIRVEYSIILSLLEKQSQYSSRDLANVLVEFW